MKNNTALPLEAPYSKSNTARKPAKALKAKPLPKTAATKRRGKLIDPDALEETKESTQTVAFKLYLKRIAATPRLSPKQEIALGSRIRAGFDALLQHLLPSGRVGDMLLEHAKAEVSRTNCEPPRRSALAAALTRTEAELQNARERFAPGAVVANHINAEVATALRDLVAVLEIWPDHCLELLAQVEREFSGLQPQVSNSPETAPQAEFARRNLMDTATCGTFLAEARRLRAVAVAARNEMVDANLQLVVATAKKMKHAYLSFEDLVQEGNRGLLTAAERFDERLGLRFSTFAVSVIKTDMRRENDNQGRTIRLPVHRCDALRKLESARVQIESEIHQAASVERLSQKTGFSCSKVRELTVLKQGTVSLDQEAGDEGGQTLGDFLPDPASLTPFYWASETAGILDPYLEHLTGAQRNVLAYVYGIGGHPLLSLKETGDMLGLAHSEVSRLHQSALRALRSAIPSQMGSHGYACAA